MPEQQLQIKRDPSVPGRLYRQRQRLAGRSDERAKSIGFSGTERASGRSRPARRLSLAAYGFAGHTIGFSETSAGPAIAQAEFALSL
jgi:hypothetical protein